MKRLICYIAPVLLLFAAAGCKKSDDRHDRKIQSISGMYHNHNPLGTDRKSFDYGFEYDELGRVVKLTYVGELYLYGEGLIPATYVYEVDHSGAKPVVVLHAIDPYIDTGDNKIPYEGIPEEETLPITFNEQGAVSSIAGRELWFHVANTTLGYADGNLQSIREDDNAYYKTTVDLAWNGGDIVKQTYNELNLKGEPIAPTERKTFHYAGMKNDYSVDLNWLTGNIGLKLENGLTMQALLGLLGGRGQHLIDRITEFDGSEVAIDYTLDGNTITKINWESLGGNYSFTISYY